MWIHVLGSAAGGGFPQWNCNCANCSKLRKGQIKAKARTQSSLALSADGEQWVLCNASPDIRVQLEVFPAIQPSRTIRDTGLIGIVLTDSQIDHTAGLLILREGKPLNIYCTAAVYQDLTTGNPLLSILQHYCGIHWHPLLLKDGGEFAVEGMDRLRFTAVPLQSEAPPYSPARHTTAPLGTTIALYVKDLHTSKTLFYAPGLGKIESHLDPYLRHADCLLIDGTFWRDDELIALGIANKRAQDMGHLALAGEGGMLQLLQSLSCPHKILVHINNTNPILDEESPERATLERVGIAVAYDGMDIIL